MYCIDASLRIVTKSLYGTALTFSILSVDPSLTFSLPSQVSDLASLSEEELKAEVDSKLGQIVNPLK
jgi:hypothetical protein